MRRLALRRTLLPLLTVPLLLCLAAGYIPECTRGKGPCQSASGQEETLEWAAVHAGSPSALGSLSQQTVCPTCGGSGEVICPDCGGTGGSPCSWCGGTGLTECLTCHGTGRCFACNGTGECQACESWYAVYDTPCPTCGGTGLCQVCGGTGLCYACDGTGTKPCWHCGGTGLGEECQRCGGSGKIECPTCGGTGLITEEEKESIDAFLTDTRGDVKIIRNGKEVTSATLEAGDEIRTGDDGVAEIAFLDGTLIRISPNCRIVFGELVEDLRKAETSGGRIWALIRRDRWEIETPSAVIGVRGTEFTLEVAEDDTTTLTVLEDTVEFSDRALTQTVLVGPNQTSVMTPDGNPSDPIPIDPIAIDRWWKWEDEGTEIPLRISPTLAIMVAMLTLLKSKRM